MSATETTRSTGFVDVSAELLLHGYRVQFRAEGSSMYPTIRDKEAITVASAQPSEIRKGDIVLYRLRHGVIAHRVVSIERSADGVSSLVLRGDAADSGDAPVAPDQILGKVVFVDRAGRRIRLTGRWARLRQLLRARASRVKQSLRPARPVPDQHTPLSDSK